MLCDQQASSGSYIYIYIYIFCRLPVDGVKMQT